MPRMNEMLGAAARLSRAAAVFFNLEEQEGVPTVAPEFVPTFDLHSRDELWALQQGTLWTALAAVAVGGAGNRSQSSIHPGEGEIAIVEGIFIDMLTEPQLVFGLSATPLTDSTGNLVSRDARRIITAGASGNTGTRCLTQQTGALANVAAVVMNFRGEITAGMLGGPLWIPLGIVLVRPWSLRLYPTSDNVAIDSHQWIGRSRPATPRELAIGAI